MIVGEDSTGEEGPAVGVRLEPGVAQVDGAVEPIQLLRSATQPGVGGGEVRSGEIVLRTFTCWPRLGVRSPRFVHQRRDGSDR